jgi:hypothetical protein
MLITLVVFVAATNLIVYSYGRGVLRTAVDEAARAGSLQGTPGGPIVACQDKADQVMANLLAGPFGQHITITCQLSGAQVVAVATGTRPAWLRLLPAYHPRVVGSATLSADPNPGA